MSKNIVIALLAALIAVGVFVFVHVQRSAQSNQSVSSVPTRQQVPAYAEVSRSLRELIMEGVNQVCAISADNGSDQPNTIFLSGNRARGSFYARTDAAGNAVMSHLIIDGDMWYVWQDGETMGLVMHAADLPNAPRDTTAVGFDTTFVATCEPWEPVASSFTPPSRIMFHTLEGGMMPATSAGDHGMMEGFESAGAPLSNEEMQELQCRTCAAIDDESERRTCEGAFGCTGI